jgi:LmbE family N-acetylglucosaminyl deacetylase
MGKKRPNLVLCAHNDDQIIGAGGTLAKEANEGRPFKTIIFAFGESSHPHLKPEVIIETRIKESLASDRILGGSGIAYLGLKEGKFGEEIKNKKIKARLREVIKKENPDKILTHTADDPHPDHRAVYKLIQELIKDKTIKCDVYGFEIWNLLSWKHKKRPRMVVDVSDTFDQKIKALKAHQSQKMTIISLTWKIYLKNIIAGFDNHIRYAEVFYKLK